MLKIGPYTITSIETCSFGLDGGAMFGVVPKALWARSNPPDGENRIEMRARAMLIRAPKSSAGPARNILVDSGMGEKWKQKHVDMYAIDHSVFSMDRSLAAQGLKREDITDVIQTHLHFDHAGGLTRFEKTGDPTSAIIPSFPNAKVFVQKRNWDLAWHPSEKDRASYLTENYAPYKDAATFGRKLEIVDSSGPDPDGSKSFSDPVPGETEIYPGISVWVSHGHTLGMQLVRVSDGKTSITYCADLIPTATHVRVPFIMAYDNYPMFILKEKKLLLDRVVQEKGFLFYEHCPKMPASAVDVDEKGQFKAGASIDL